MLTGNSTEHLRMVRLAVLLVPENARREPPPANAFITVLLVRANGHNAFLMRIVMVISVGTVNCQAWIAAIGAISISASMNQGAAIVEVVA